MNRLPFLIPGVITVFVFGQNRDPEAEQILRSAFEAHGADVLTGSDTLASGRLISYSPGEKLESQIQMATRGFNQQRTEITRPGVSRLYVSNGRAAWVVTDGEKKRLATDETDNKVIGLNPAAGILGAFSSGRLELVYEGLIVRDGAQYYQVTATIRDQDSARNSAGQPIDREFHILVDPATNLVASISYLQQSARGISREAVHEYRYLDYQDVGGVRVPFRIEKSIYGQKRHEILLTAFQRGPAGDVFKEP